jgi:glycosyltransferase involved in cell wall biosynthesis
MGTLPHDVYIVAAFLAARELRLPFYAHMHDLWIENMRPGSPLAQFAASWEPVILKQATRVLCMTEAMQEYYERKYGIRSYLLPHTIAERDLHKIPCGISPARMVSPKVLFVGTVSPPMNLDALKVLAAASELLPPSYDLIFCTSTDKATLDRLGIRSSRLRVMYVSRAEVQRLQSEAHVLVAPLSHKNCSMDEVRTVFSTKLLEYLISGRPIVVFAPQGSYHAESAHERSWGYVVTEDSPAALAKAIMTVVTDEDLAASLVRGALTEALSRNAKTHAERLHHWVVSDAGATIASAQAQSR